jgi:transcriptional regulator GlxA family with amidase domain
MQSTHLTPSDQPTSTKPKHISILVPNGMCVLSTIVGTHNILSVANDHWQSKGGKTVFDVQLVGISKEINLYNGLFTIRPELLIDEVHKTDLIIIPALQGDFEEGLKLNREFTPWITRQYKQGAEIASLCTGSFLLASTGLLKGRKCTTHWVAEGLFRQLFPEVDLVTDRIITEERGIYSSGGAFSFLNFILYLVEKYYGRDTAVYCSKVCEIDMERSCQSPFSIFFGDKTHEDEPIKKAQLFMENNVGDKITIERLAAMSALSRRNFERRFKRATSNTPVEYLQRVKVEAAKKSLESGRENVNDVMYAVGYSDSKAFRTIFKKITGLSPLEYRNKYNRAQAV